MKLILLRAGGKVFLIVIIIRGYRRAKPPLPLREIDTNRRRKEGESEAKIDPLPPVVVSLCQLCLPSLLFRLPSLHFKENQRGTGGLKDEGLPPKRERGRKRKTTRNSPEEMSFNELELRGKDS